LHWLARFIATDGPANADALLALLAAWDPGNLDAAWGPPAGLHTALDRILDKLEQRAPGARRCFEALGVLPALPMVFDELIVQALGAAEGAAEETVNECVSALVAHELVLERDNASNPRQPGGPRRQLALRPEVQDIASRMLTKERAGHLQDAAARHYFDRVSKVFDSVSYGIWYELETKSWQGAVVHLLHHLPGADPAFATLVFSDLFLKSIWWWDYYIPWEFCDKFLEAGDNITVVQHLARKFAELRSAYPRVPVPGRHQMAGSWGRALGLLVDITDKVQEARDVLGPPIGSEEPIWWYEPSGILHILKGHCWRFLGRYDNATAELQQALSIFEENGDHWDQAWVLYELAEVALERHDPALEGYLKAARKRLERLERVDDAPEHELAALCHRVEADMLAALGAPAGLVASSYAVAIWETLAFNLVPKRPDLYTQRLCQELAAHTAAWLSELGESSYPVATAKIHELWESWGWVLPKAPAWTDPSQASAAELDRRKVNLEKVVRPPLPSRKELLEGYTSAFTRRTVPLLVKRQATMYWQLVKNGCRAHGPAWHPEPLGAFEVVADPEPALAREFYRRVLAPAFPPDELEPITTFESCLAKDLSTPGSARALVMLDPAGREPIAGTVSYWYPDSKAWLLGYLAVLEGFRGSGIAPHLIEALVDQWHTDPEAVLGVAEVEDPRHFPGPEAEARLRMYSRAGAHLIATDFVQPKVDTDQPRVPHLMLACLYAAPSAFVKTFQPALASRIVANFIAEYFSVAEQLTEPGSDPQVAWLLERASACAQVVAGDDVAGILLVDPSQYGEVPDGEPPAI
jgi:GNAT superfamily N-acetyltransferase